MRASTRTSRTRARAARLEAKRALEAERARIADIVASLPDALWSAELPDEQLLYVSPGANEVFGCAPEELLARHDLRIELVHPEDRAAVLQAWRNSPASGSFEVEYRIVTADGATRWINDRARVIRDDAGTARRIDGLARDITVQVENRRRIARLFRIREFISHINAALIRLHDRDALFGEVCRIAVEYGGLRGAQIVLLDEATGWISRSASAGASASHDSPDRTGIESAAGIVAQSIRSGKPAVCNQCTLERDTRQAAAKLAAGAHSAASFPLQVEDRIIGALSLNAGEPGFFDDTEIRLLQEFAANIGTALELMLRQDRLIHHALYDALSR